MLKSAAVLKTKLFVPSLGEDHVPRRALSARLREGIEKRLTVMTAPAGFGKSTALAELFHGLDRPACRLSLGPSDDEPSRFWSHFGYGLGQLFPGLGRDAGRALQSASPPAVTDVLESWLNDLAGRDDLGVFALDDFHVVEDSEILRDLGFWLDHQPPGLHLILCGRLRPRLPLARMRGRGELCEIETRDLQLSADEAERYLRRRLGDRVSADQAAALYRRCEGWPAALQLAASLLERGSGSVDDLIRELPAHTDVADYMAEEILAGMPPERRRHLMRLSVLEAFDAELCAALTDEPPVDDLPALLEAERLPVLRLDGEGRWMRFHHLFRDFLHRRLERTAPGTVAELHRRADDALEASGDLEGALHHALAAGDLPRTLDRLTRAAGALIARGESRTVVRAVEGLETPREELPPDLLLQLASALYITNRTDECRSVVATLETFDDKGLLEPRQSALLIAQRGAVARSRDGDLDAARRDFARALDLLADGPRELREWVALQLGVVHLYAYELDAALEAFELSSPPSAPPHERGAFAFGSMANQAYARATQGRLHLAEELCRQILQVEPGEERAGAPGLSVTWRTLGTVHLQRGEWDSAREAFENARRTGRLSGFDEMPAFATLGLAELARATGDADALDRRLNDFERMAERGSLTPVHLGRHRALRLHRRLDEGDLQGAERLARRFPPSPGPPSMLDEAWRVAWARARAEAGHEEEARKTFSTLLDAARRQGRLGAEIELLVWLAWLDHRNGRPRAFEHWDRAVHRAREQGFVGPFLVPPKAGVAGLVDRHMAHLPPSETPELDLRLRRELPSLRPAPRRAAGPQLTEKEQQVLARLAEGRTNAQIADDLGVAPSTVKTHLKHLFAKLEVHRRTQAVARARELGWL